VHISIDRLSAAHRKLCCKDPGGCVGRLFGEYLARAVCGDARCAVCDAEQCGAVLDCTESCHARVQGVHSAVFPGGGDENIRVLGLSDQIHIVEVVTDRPRKAAVGRIDHAHPAIASDGCLGGRGMALEIGVVHAAGRLEHDQFVLGEGLARPHIGEGCKEVDAFAPRDVLGPCEELRLVLREGQGREGRQKLSTFNSEKERITYRNPIFSAHIIGHEGKIVQNVSFYDSLRA
jgi:hypothetical protein